MLIVSVYIHPRDQERNDLTHDGLYEVLNGQTNDRVFVCGDFNQTYREM